MNRVSMFPSTRAVVRLPSPATDSRDPTAAAVSAWTVVRVCRRRSASVPEVTDLPRRMMLTRSARASTSERMWLDSKHRRALLAAFADHALEQLLHQGVEPRGRLIEDDQLDVAGQRRDERDLLPVALGVVPCPLGRIEVEAFDQVGPPAGVHAAVHPGQDVHALPAGQTAPERHVTGHVGHVGP